MKIKIKVIFHQIIHCEV